jgi:glutamyl-tRNA reductase
LTPAIVGLRGRTRAVLTAEVERSLAGKLRHLPVADREALSMMIEAMTNKLLHGPVTRLRGLAADPRAEDYVEAVRDLWDLPEGGEAVEPVAKERGAERRSNPGALEESGRIALAASGRQVG